MSIDLSDRRIHRVFVTRNTEYHVRRDLCVGVRDLRSGEWRRAHQALFRRIAGAVRLLGNGSLTVNERLPDAGESLLFEGRDGALTSPVVSVERPALELVTRYPDAALAAS